MEKEDFNFEKEYNILKEKYNLPPISSISEDFDIEKLFEKESHFILREIRRTILDKISAYVNLFETLINPSSPPMFVFSILRTMNEEDKTKIKEMYKKLSRIHVKAMILDTIYSEKEEAEFIKKYFDEWQELKKEVYLVFQDFEKNFDKENGSKKSGYLG